MKPVPLMPFLACKSWLKSYFFETGLLAKEVLKI